MPLFAWHRSGHKHQLGTERMKRCFLTLIIKMTKGQSCKYDFCQWATWINTSTYQNMSLLNVGAHKMLSIVRWLLRTNSSDLGLSVPALSFTRTLLHNTTNRTWNESRLSSMWWRITAVKSLLNRVRMRGLIKIQNARWDADGVTNPWGTCVMNVSARRHMFRGCACIRLPNSTFADRQSQLHAFHKLDSTSVTEATSLRRMEFRDA